MTRPFHVEHYEPPGGFRTKEQAEEDDQDPEAKSAQSHSLAAHPTQPAEGPDDPEYTGEAPR